MRKEIPVRRKEEFSTKGYLEHVKWKTHNYERMSENFIPIDRPNFDEENYGQEN